MLSKFQFSGAGNDRSFWMVLGLLLLAVLLPTVCLLYFINEAVGNQRDLARQELGDAYAGQLRMARERIDAFWEQRARDLDVHSDAESPSLFFEHCVRDGLADSVICLNNDGTPAYPSLAVAPQPDPAAHQPRWLEARALEDNGKLMDAAARYAAIGESEKDPSIAGRAVQSYIRCLAASGRKQAAIDVIDQQFSGQSSGFGLIYATSLDGRLLVADELLLAIQLMPAGDRRRERTLQRLWSILQNYSRQMPSAQRLFLMDWMRALGVAPKFRLFPTYAAERIAERILSTGRANSSDAALRLSGLADVWKMTAPSGKVVALYDTKTVLASIRRFLEPGRSSRDPVFAITLPGRPQPPYPQSIAIGSHLPGWQISLNIEEFSSSKVLSGRRTATYLWIGFLTLATVVALAVAGGQILRRQMRVSHLKADLVAAVSHELKTPLASMKLLVESLLRADQLEPKRTRQYLEMVARENTRLSRLIDNFLTFSRMERNSGRFVLARVQPEAVVHAAVESIGERYRVEVEMESGLPALYADEDALVSVLLNLLDNAYRYSGEDRQIWLRVSFERGRVWFAVKDNGIGIADRDRKKIFRRFYQVDRGLARQTGGVGLGLSIVEFIVKAHHGAVSVSSRPGAGSTFTVSLPPSSSAAGVAA